MTTLPYTLGGIDHVVIRAKDIERMLGFYRDVIGLTVAKHNEPLGLWHLDAGGSMIDLVDMNGKLGAAGGPAPDAGRNVDHVALKVAPFDEAAIRAHFAAHGIEAEEAKTRFGAEGDGPSIYLRDPEGNGVELKAKG
ncbi:MAG: VOC family protein [Alphaproteobacteria bacterium]|nr:VOC family protein [Alphaproteobacteria bacterium]